MGLTSMCEQLRPAVYLFAGDDDDLIIEMLMAGRRRRSRRILALALVGLKVEHDQNGIVLAGGNQSLTKETGPTCNLTLGLRVSAQKHPLLYEDLRQSPNRSDRIRTLARSGLLTEQNHRLHCNPVAVDPPAKNEPPKPGKRARSLMASMVSELTSGELL